MGRFCGCTQTCRSNRNGVADLKFIFENLGKCALVFVAIRLNQEVNLVKENSVNKVNK